MVNINNNLKLNIDLLNDNLNDTKTNLEIMTTKQKDTLQEFYNSQEQLKWYLRILQTFRETLLISEEKLDEQILQLVNNEEKTSLNKACAEQNEISVLLESDLYNCY